MSHMRALGMASYLAAAVALAGCGEQQAPPSAGNTSVPVQTVTVAAEPLALASTLPGRVEPMRVAEVRARVAGIVLHKRFEEGADVKAGDVLFQIDPAPFKAALSRAEAELARARSVMLEAQARVRRYQPLVKIEAVSQQDFDTASADLRSGQAAVRSAQADVETAQLYLGYATVKAPISGRIGRALITEGALVGQGDATLMARIQQLDPIYVDFTQPAADALRLRQALKNGALAAGENPALTARVEGTDYQRQGTLMFTDVAVDRGTGQVTLRGRFDNADGILLPGMYVRVLTPQGIDNRAILVPQRAIQRGNDGEARVLLVGKGGIAEARNVRTGAMQGARWQVIEGLQPGDQVIVGSPAGLAAGMPVTLSSAQQAAAR
ncbi:MexC family multidrug efflux RND transporter periplasmic adaptor subunit [Pseudomonas sp. NBRC 111124]|uniref:MexC family multidrug efflux RND transporter periplasmic adaptor subunit n=1 Tax=Pseudomonas sp. NBRC 111124 TaxID=1661039 RepID=UPI000760EDF2|nr:MexC family multidrug efflux RND transporter periplasmic adaptor subunit [Pseudomonas sp. NBRC 111124]